MYTKLSTIPRMRIHELLWIPLGQLTAGGSMCQIIQHNLWHLFKLEGQITRFPHRKHRNERGAVSAPQTLQWKAVRHLAMVWEACFSIVHCKGRRKMAGLKL